jgi:hypothetical protein
MDQGSNRQLVSSHPQLPLDCPNWLTIGLFQAAVTIKNDKHKDSVELWKAYRVEIDNEKAELGITCTHTLNTSSFVLFCFFKGTNPQDPRRSQRLSSKSLFHMEVIFVYF